MNFFSNLIRRQGVFISWMTAVIATAGSLFFSQVMEFIPCTLCWYQRILMYPLAIILLIATIKEDRNVSVYVLPFSLLGSLLSLYHYLLQKTNWFPEADQACGLIPCTTQYINWFGFVTIPFLALAAFTLISFIHLTIWTLKRKEIPVQ